MRGGRPSRAGLAPVLIAILTTVVAGCEYLYGSEPLDPDDLGLPTPIATYANGEASITVGDEPAIALRALESGSVFDDAWYGAEATWSNPDGWYVRVNGATSGSVLGLGGSVTLDRIVDGEHWTTYDPSRCIVTIEAADEKGLRGSATCKGLRWSDAIGGSWTSLTPSYIEGQDAFDAEITFEARPATTSQG